MLSFEDDYILERRIREESNYCDVAHLYATTFGICQVILMELWSLDLDGNGRLTLCANVEQPNKIEGYFNWKGAFNVSTYNLPLDISRRLYEFKKFDADVHSRLCESIGLRYTADKFIPCFVGIRI